MLQGFFFDRECRAVAPLLWDDASGGREASGPDAARIAAHLARCPRCRAREDAFRAAARALAVHAAMPPGGIPDRPGDWPGVQTRLAAALAAADRLAAPSRPPALRPGLAGGLALVLGTALCSVGIDHARQWDAARNQQEQAAAVLAAAHTAPQQAAPSAVVPGPAAASRAWSITRFPLAADVPVEMSANPCWWGRSGVRVFPIVVTVRNHTGKPLTAQLTAEASAYQRIYVRPLVLPADEAVHRYFLYPASSITASAGIRVTLTGAFTPQETTLFEPGSGNAPLCMVGDHPGRLEPIPAKQTKISSAPAQGNYTKPETAPDRAAGYAGASALVLGAGVARMSAAQWGAIRDWVRAGGALIALPEAGTLPKALQPDAPVTKEEAVPIPQPATFWGQDVRRYPLGLGTVLRLDFDPTDVDFRKNAQSLKRFWEAATRAAAPVVYADGLAAGSANPYLSQTYRANAASQQNSAFRQEDPFHIPLPPVASVLYLFLSYFVLAVPVAFVLLRRTGRMNLAWGTGPLLAAGFGGAVYLFMVGLHGAHLSRRTSGVLLAAAGDPTARFSGYTELYFPRGGRYALTLPGAETMERVSPLDLSPGTPADRQIPGAQAFETIDRGNEITAPALSVGNLSYRRVFHSQTVTWGGGVTADLRLTSEGILVGSIHNGTGRTLSDAEIALPTAAGARLGWTLGLRYSVLLSSLSPGTTALRERVAWSRSTHLRAVQLMSQSWMPDSSWGSPSAFAAPVSDEPITPVLTAQMSAESFGPQIGRWVGGEDTTRVIVTLPPLRGDAAALPATKEVRP